MRRCRHGGRTSIKVGIVAPFSGPFADYGKQFEAGVKAFQKINGDTVAGRKVEVIIKDTGGPSPEVAKRLAQELVVRDKVDFLAGFGLTPEALAVADIATQAKKPMVIFNAATSIITTKSPYIARTSMTLPQISAPIGTWAAKNGIKKVVHAGGRLRSRHRRRDRIQEDVHRGRRAGRRVDPHAAAESRLRARSSSASRTPSPTRCSSSCPPAQQSIAFMKAFSERGLAQAGIKVIATGDVTDDHVLNAMGDAALGMITTFHYSAAHDSPENKAFLEAYAEVAPNAGRANFMTVGAYDGMALIYEVIAQARRQDRRRQGDGRRSRAGRRRARAARSPSIPQTRDIVQTIYVRRVEKKGGELWNVEFDKFDNVKDPGKQP